MLFVYLAGASLLALVYPYAIYPFILRFLPKFPNNVPSEDISTDTRAALLFCAHNEEASLPAKIQNIRAIKQDYPGLEVLVYTDACTDGSVAILREAEDVLTVHQGHSRIGKASGMRTLVGATDADILIFTDANVTVEPASVRRIISYFADPAIGTVAGTLRYTNSDDSSTAQTGSVYWRLEEMIKRLESETGSTMGADGSLFATRHSVYPRVPANLLDDMIASISPIFSGFRVISAPDVRAFERATVKSGDEFLRKRRIACRAFNTHRYLLPHLYAMGLLNRFKYFSHKYIRWFSIVPLVLSVIFAFCAIAELSSSIIAIAVVAACLVLWLLGRRFDFPVIATLTEIMLAMLATGIGVVEGIAGREYKTWAPARDRSS